MFAACESLHEAKQVFSQLHRPSVYAWATIILAHTNLGQRRQAIFLYYQMKQSKVEPNEHIFVAVLKACSSIASLEEGKQIHAHIIERKSELDIFVGNTLIDMYAKCGSFTDARRVFDNLPNRTVASWSAMIAGYAQHEQGEQAFRLFHEMRQEGMQPNDITFVCILKACCNINDLDQGKLIHSHIEDSNLVSDLLIGNTLIHMYAKCGSLEDAHKVFDQLSVKGIVTWNTMITGYAQQGYGQQALQLFQQMKEEGVDPNHFTFACILNACSNIAALEQGMLIHVCIIVSGKWDAYIGSTLIGMYSKCGKLKDAQNVFDTLPKWEVVAYSVLIAGYTQHGHGTQALALFHQMEREGLKPNDMTFVCVLKACSNIKALHQGKLIHCCIIACCLELVDFIGNTLIDMYVKCGSLEDACRIFYELPKQSVVTWNAMMLGYAQHGYDQEALLLFQQMQKEGFEPSNVTFVNILKACSNISALDQGKLVHDLALRQNCELHVALENTLIDMYSKCGSLEDAVRVFKNLSTRDVITWSAMIAGCANCSAYELALEYFNAMQREGLEANEAIFLCLLSASSHVGLLDEGFYHLKRMESGLGITPIVDHYNCMVDLLGRVGCLKEAEDLLLSIPYESNVMGWLSLLSHCKTYVNVELGRLCFNHVVLLDHRHASGYVLMFNVYADASMSEDTSHIKELRTMAHAWKKPGKAFIEVDSNIRVFFVADKNQLQSNVIYASQQRLCAKMRNEGYVPHVDSVMQPFSNEEEDNADTELTFGNLYG